MKRISRFRWFKKAKITLETIRFWEKYFLIVSILNTMKAC